MSLMVRRRVTWPAISVGPWPTTGYDGRHAQANPTMIDVAAQLDLGIRLIIAAALGAAVGAEREIHGHPAGIRTHMLVALGSALFTVMSIHGFSG